MSTNKNRLYLLLPFRCIFFLLIFILGSTLTKLPLEAISYWWSIVATFVNFTTILLIIAIAKKSKISYWNLINYEKGKTDVKSVITVSFFIILIGMVGMYLAGFLCYKKIPYAAPMMIAPIPLWIAILNVLLLPISTAFAEEGLYLGCGVNQIKNKYLAIIFPSFFFALQHSFIPTLFDFRYMFYRFLSFLPLTIILCWYFYKKRNPLPIMIGHALIDLATALQILASSAIPGFYEKLSGL